MDGGDFSTTRLYLGNLPRDVTKLELEDLFLDYGKLTDIKIMNGFGFVEFQDEQDAKDVVPAFHGTMFKGERLTVQFARGPRIDTRDFAFRRPNPRRTSYRMQISGLPNSTSWQDLKDFARSSGADVVYTEISRHTDGLGFVEFESMKDLNAAIDKLDGTEFGGSLVTCTHDPSDSSPETQSPKESYHMRGRARSPGHRRYHPYTAERVHSSRSGHAHRGRYRERSVDCYDRDYRGASPPRAYPKLRAPYDEAYRPRAPPSSARYYDDGYRGKPYGRARSPRDGYSRGYREHW